MARKIATNGAPLGDFVNPGDRVKFFSDNTHVLAIVDRVDCDGDARLTFEQPVFCVEHRKVTHVHVLRAAPPPTPPVSETFGNVSLEYRDGVLCVNGECVSEDLVYAVAYTIGLVGVSGSESVEQYAVAWTTRISITPTRFRAGCASCSREDLVKALAWAFEQYGWGDITAYA